MMQTQSRRRSWCRQTTVFFATAWMIHSFFCRGVFAGGILDELPVQTKDNVVIFPEAADVHQDPFHRRLAKKTKSKPEEAEKEVEEGASQVAEVAEKPLDTKTKGDAKIETPAPTDAPTTTATSPPPTLAPIENTKVAAPTETPVAKPTKKLAASDAPVKATGAPVAAPPTEAPVTAPKKEANPPTKEKESAPPTKEPAAAPITPAPTASPATVAPKKTTAPPTEEPEPKETDSPESAPLPDDTDASDTSEPATSGPTPAPSPKKADDPKPTTSSTSKPPNDGLEDSAMPMVIFGTFVLFCVGLGAYRLLGGGGGSKVAKYSTPTHGKYQGLSTFGAPEDDEEWGWGDNNNSKTQQRSVEMTTGGRSSSLTHRSSSPRDQKRSKKGLSVKKLGMKNPLQQQPKQQPKQQRTKTPPQKVKPVKAMATPLPKEDDFFSQMGFSAQPAIKPTGKVVTKLAPSSGDWGDDDADLDDLLND